MKRRVSPIDLHELYHESPSFVVVIKIKEEARLWVIAGAKKLGSIMPGE
jgi:hypothetical protein